MFYSHFTHGKTEAQKDQGHTNGEQRSQDLNWDPRGCGVRAVYLPSSRDAVSGHPRPHLVPQEEATESLSHRLGVAGERAPLSLLQPVGPASQHHIPSELAHPEIREPGCPGPDPGRLGPHTGLGINFYSPQAARSSSGPGQPCHSLATKGQPGHMRPASPEATPALGTQQVLSK